MKEENVSESLLDRMDDVVKSTVNSTVVLQSKKGVRMILTGAETLKIKSFCRQREETYV